MSALSAQTAVTGALSALFGGRLYPLAGLEAPTYPYAVLSLELASVENTLCGRSDLTNYRFRLDVYAETQAELLALRPQIMEAMDPLGLLVLETEAYEPEIRAMRRVMDFSVWNKE